jgi:hypothetical protein
MAKTAFFYNEITGVIDGYSRCSIDSDIALNTRTGFQMMLVGNEHRAIGKENEYRVNGGKIQRRPQVDIDAEQKIKDDIKLDRRTPTYLKPEEEMIKEVFVDYIDKLQKNAGLSGININDFNNALDAHREKNKNPAKKPKP